MTSSFLLYSICAAAMVLGILILIGSPGDNRKLAAKKHNERIKLLATTLNAIGLGILGATTIGPTFGVIPNASGSDLPPAQAGILAFGAIFFTAITTYHFMRSEE